MYHTAVHNKIKGFNAMKDKCDSRMKEIRAHSREWNLWYRWYRWFHIRVKHYYWRRATRDYRRARYWYGRFNSLKPGSKLYKHALKEIKSFIDKLLGFYKRYAKYYNGKMDKYRPHGYRWRRQFYLWRAYTRAVYHVMSWYMRFHQRWRRRFKSSSDDYKKVTKGYEDTKKARDAYRDAYIKALKAWEDSSKLKHSWHNWKVIHAYYKRYAARAKTYSVRSLRKAEHAWWRLRSKDHGESDYKAAWAAMSTQREALFKLYDQRDKGYLKKMYKYRAHYRGKAYRYWFRRLMYGRYYKWREMYRMQWFTRYAMTHNCKRGSREYKRLWKQWRYDWSRIYGQYRKMYYALRYRLHKLRRRSSYWNYWYRWYRWVIYRIRHYYRWKASFNRRRGTRWRQTFWKLKYRSSAYYRMVRRFWKWWYHAFKYYVKRWVQWRYSTHRTKPWGHKRWRYSFSRMMRYTGRTIRWIGWWIRFTRKRQRTFTKKGTALYNRLEKYINAWKRWRKRVIKMVVARLQWWKRHVHSGTRGYKLVDRYLKSYGGRETWRSVYRTLRVAEHKALRGSADWGKIKEYRDKLMKFYDERAKYWWDYEHKNKKASKRYNYGYRKWFWWNYYAMREYRRGYRIAKYKKNNALAKSDFDEVKKRLNKVHDIMIKDRKGLYNRSYLYRFLRSYDYWLMKRYRHFK